MVAKPQGDISVEKPYEYENTGQKQRATEHDCKEDTMPTSTVRHYKKTCSCSDDGRVFSPVEERLGTRRAYFSRVATRGVGGIAASLPRWDTNWGVMAWFFQVLQITDLLHRVVL